MVRIIHLWQSPNQHRLAIHGLADLALEIDAEQFRPRLIDEAIGLAFDFDDVRVFRDRPERTIAVRLRPVDGSSRRSSANSRCCPSTLP
jgi:hypothetical protein